MYYTGGDAPRLARILAGAFELIELETYGELEEGDSLLLVIRTPGAMHT